MIKNSYKKKSNLTVNFFSLTVNDPGQMTVLNDKILNIGQNQPIN